ncbi:MAG: hypothetical protein KME20_23020 [Kaiparowitsia implicata GSE-PSE-MK54-09C]|jgi:hypothetical protein|nr:hypothetical protein [Kaiparowitsia implicata GSE-PSE-MK54-09C]
MMDITRITTDLSAEETLLLLLTLHLLIGFIGALVAAHKGRDLRLWLLIGPACGTPALLVALIMKRQPRQPTG